MSSEETTRNEKFLKVHIIDPNTGNLFDQKGQFVVGLIGNVEKDHVVFTTMYMGELTGVDILMTVKALKETIIPALLDSVKVSEQEADAFFEIIEGELDGNS